MYLWFIYRRNIQNIHQVNGCHTLSPVFLTILLRSFFGNAVYWSLSSVPCIHDEFTMLHIYIYEWYRVIRSIHWREFNTELEEYGVKERAGERTVSWQRAWVDVRMRECGDASSNWIHRPSPRSGTAADTIPGGTVWLFYTRGFPVEMVLIHIENVHILYILAWLFIGIFSSRIPMQLFYVFSQINGEEKKNIKK